MNADPSVELVSLADSLQPLREHFNTVHTLRLLAVVSPT
jgi:hypothetical protein